MTDHLFTPTIPTPDAWDAFVRAHPRAHLLQLSEWGAHKRAFGWRDARVAVTDERGAILGGALLLFRPLPARLGSMAYVAMAPLLDPARAADITLNAAVWRAIDHAAKRDGAAFVRWEPGIYESDPPPDPERFGFRPALAPIQPPRTVLIDLADDDAMLARMNQGTRRKIRQSLKGEVTYIQAARADLPRFTALMDATGERNAFGTYESAYYDGMFERFAPDDAALILAQHTESGQALAGVMVFAVGSSAWYLYGGSSDAHRNLMASYGAQWGAIQWARARGCTVYDMWGIPDAEPDRLEAEFETRADGLWGVYGFKRGWGGRIVRSLGAWDRVYNPLVFTLYQTAVR
ncbi:MAG: peptidoglycan bridge formation glycyltransferase FemA/FemB family protein, partial [bacterium]|nr:peptidoglycan bridge formation glycyltransferase FemA/FemB family protein [bacterium]